MPASTTRSMCTAPQRAGCCGSSPAACASASPSRCSTGSCSRARSSTTRSTTARSSCSGRATLVGDDEKREALHAFTEQLAPALGRGAAADGEGAEGDLDPLAAARRGLGEGAERAARGRAGGLDLPVWAGVVPVHLAAEPTEYSWCTACTTGASSARRTRIRSLPMSGASRVVRRSRDAAAPGRDSRPHGDRLSIAGTAG